MTASNPVVDTPPGNSAVMLFGAAASAALAMDASG